jgi:type II secretion system protein G
VNLTGIVEHACYDDVMKKRGFTLMELLVVIAIIGVLAAVVLASLSAARAKARDARRLADMKSIETALDLYFTQNGTYPPNVNSSYSCTNCGCWAPDDDPTFLQALITGGHLSGRPRDPNVTTTCGNYRYYRYEAGDNGCPVAWGRYYFLQVRNMENTSAISNVVTACSGNPAVTASYFKYKFENL